MARIGIRHRWKAIFKAWPWPGALFVMLAFMVTIWWLVQEFEQVQGSWLEPLAALLGGLGAFILAAILITRKVQSTTEQADCYEVSRGLAVGYYFNFIRPLVAVLRDAEQPAHQNAQARGVQKIAGLVVGIPEKTSDFAAEAHDKIYDSIEKKGDIDIVTEQVDITGRPRPLNVRLAVNKNTKTAVIVDIPTTLAVIPNYAEFLAEQELADHNADENVQEARRQLIMAHETGRFSQVIADVSEAVYRIGAQESWGRSPAALCRIVPVSGLREEILVWTKS